MIACDLHDYIEIACTYGYKIILTMNSGDVVEGVALDTQLNSERTECIKIKHGKQESLIVLEDVASMAASTENPHFSLVKFK